jgi:hypothetical protein
VFNSGNINLSNRENDFDTDIPFDSFRFLKLHFTIDGITMRDQFEWDINASENQSNPELFASSLCADLGLPREFQVAIAHSIRDQLVAYHKLVRTGQFVERPSIMNPIRSEDDIDNWTPVVGPAEKLAESFNNPSR